MITSFYEKYASRGETHVFFNAVSKLSLSTHKAGAFRGILNADFDMGMDFDADTLISFTHDPTIDIGEYLDNFHLEIAR